MFIFICPDCGYTETNDDREEAFKAGCVHEINEHGFEDETARRIVNENIKEE